MVHENALECLLESDSRLLARQMRLLLVLRRLENELATMQPLACAGPRALEYLSGEASASEHAVCPMADALELEMRAETLDQK